MIEVLFRLIRFERGARQVFGLLRQHLAALSVGRKHAFNRRLFQIPERTFLSDPEWLPSEFKVLGINTPIRVHVPVSSRYVF